MNAEEAFGAQIVNRSSLAALVFLAYDICLTLGDEIKYIWSKPHASLSKWLFILLRWFTLSVLITFLFVGTELGVSLGTSSAPYCRSWYTFQMAALQFIVALMEIILAQRVYALYNRSRIVGGVLLLAFLAEEAVMAVSLATSLPRVTFNDICISLSVPDAVVWFGIPPIIFEFLLLALTVGRFIAHTRTLGWGRAPLLHLLARDGLWAFLLVFGCFGLNGVFYLLITGPSNATVWAWQYAVAAFAGSRLMLNIHTDPLSPAATRASGSGSRARTPATSARANRNGESAFELTTFVPVLGMGDEESATEAPIEMEDVYVGGGNRVEGTLRRAPFGAGRGR